MIVILYKLNYYFMQNDIFLSYNMFYNEYCWSFKKKAVILQVIKIKI